MTGDLCTLCEALQRPNHPDAYRPEEFSPCPACLSTPATDEIREAWQQGTTAAPATWPHFPEWRGRKGAFVLPLYLDAGLDLGCRVLARRWRIFSAAQIAAMLEDGDTQAFRWWLEDHEVDLPDGLRDLFATIPADAPPNLRVRLAMKLCLEAT